MQESSTLAGAIQQTITRVLAEHRAELNDLGVDVEPLLDQAEQFLTGGKRFRAHFAVAGYHSVVGALDPMAETVPDFVIEVAAALELFHAAALVHDDIIDQSDTRRGKPAVHRWFENHHRTHGWRSNPERYGIASAILLGDLLQSWADELFNSAVSKLPAAQLDQSRQHFNQMRTEVAAGQYLDVLEEQLGSLGDASEQLERATRVLVYKSAKYSVEAPLLIGASLAGATDEQEQLLRDFGLPIGVAFQLRDDLLGVFGDASVTGKPSGDDLREGKRTILIALTRQHLQTSTQRVFDELLGDPALSQEQIEMMQRTISESGAVESVETMIRTNIERAQATLTRASGTLGAVNTLRELADRATQRTA